MSQFATAADLASFLHLPVDTAAMNLALQLASAGIQSYTDQLFDLVTGDTITIDVTGQWIVVLPQKPVLAVSAVSLDGSPVTAYTFDAEGELRRTDGLMWGPQLYPTGPPPDAWGSWFGGAPRRLTVTYDHGFATIPDTVRSVCLSVAAHLYANPEGLLREDAGGYLVQYNPNRSAPAELTEGEKELIDVYRQTVLA